MKHFYASFSTSVRWIVVLWSCLGLLAGPARAAGALPGGAATGSTPSLAQVLNPDGTLRPGAQGSFDAHLFRMHTAPDGRPTFSPAQVAGTGDENWQDNFRLPGTNGAVNVVVQVGTSVYIGGGFTKVGNIVANGIAKWDGTTWSSLGTGTKNGLGSYVYNSSGNVYAIAVAGNDLYVGGYFSLAGGAAASSVAKWNGTAWSSLGTGTATSTTATASPGAVYTLAVAGTSVYAGGDFAVAGGLAVNNIAKWDGTTWSSLGTGTTNGASGKVISLAALGTSVYVGGSFRTVGGIAANYIAQWDGTAWSSLGTGTANGVDNAVSAVAVMGTTVYLAGGFKKAGTVAANNVARWDGTTWSSLGTGTANGVDNVASSLLVAGTNLYIGGFFGKAGTVEANSIAQWDGTAWSSLGTGDENGVSTHSFFTNVQAIAVVGASVYAGGSFITAGSKVAKYVARWDGTTWSSVGEKANGADNEVYAVAISGTDVYVGGRFTSVGNVRASHVAKWNGTRWSALSVTDQYGYVSDGVDRDGTVYALAVAGSNLYVGGIFEGAGIVAANNVAKWDGTRWSSLGTGTANGVDAVANATVPSYVYALAVSGTNVYVGGTFGRAGGAAAANIARWNGTAWSSLGTGTANGVNSTVYALGVVGTVLYVGGDFKQAGGVAANYLARWNGTSWGTLGTGTTNGVNAGVRVMAVAGNNLYVGGGFATAGTTPVNYVAKWDGTSWSSLGTGTATGTGSTVLALAVAGSNVYVGGYLTKAGGVAANFVAKWDGTSWSPLGTGLDGTVRALGVGADAKVNVGGQFVMLGDGSKAAFYFSVYNDGPTLLASPAPAVAAQVGVYPNPAQGSFAVTMPGILGAATVRAELLTGLGQVVRRQAAPLPASGTTFTLLTNGLAPGSYILRLSAGATILTKRIVIQ